MTSFRVGPDYTIATHNGQIMEEWIGQPLDLFTKAMGCPADHVETSNICDRQVTEYIWL
jgi:hypothetical protein